MPSSGIVRFAVRAKIEMEGSSGTKKPYRRGRGEEIEAGVKLSAFSAVSFLFVV